VESRPANKGFESLLPGLTVHEMGGFMSSTNQYDICAWKDEAECSDCALRCEELGYQPDMPEFRFFTVSQLPNLALSVFGLVLLAIVTGAWWPLVAFGAACLVLWGLGLETRVLCSHCPFWAAESETMPCLELTGSPKIWRYPPGPMAAWKKATFAAFISVLLVFPSPAKGYALWTVAMEDGASGTLALLGMVGITLATILTGAQFFYIVRTRFCARCVYFSCPLNQVSRGKVNAYLVHNPVMRAAWEQSGYRLVLSSKRSSKAARSFDDWKKG
jgi:hypothetical protein